MWQGELVYQLIWPWALQVLQHILGVLFTRICSMTRESISKLWSSAWLSAFLYMCSKNLALFLGHRPCVQPHCLAQTHLPTPLLQLWNGTHCFCQVTCFRYLVAFISAYTRCPGGSTGVLAVKMKISTSQFACFLWGFLGQENGEPFSPQAT